MSGGRCLCGAVTFTIEGAPITGRQCWCRDCQYLSSGGPTQTVFLATEQLRWKGEVRWYESPADSGPTLARGFCPTCGTDLFVQSHARRHLIGVRMGALDDTGLAPPQSAIWVASAPGWAAIDPALPRVEGQPPPLR